MSGAEIPIPALVAFLNAVQEDLKNPRHFEHPNFGRLRLVPMPAPQPSLWFGHVRPFEAPEQAEVVFEVPSEEEPGLLQESTARALQRGWKVVYLPPMRELIEEVAVRLSAQHLAPMNAFDPASLTLAQMRIPFDPVHQPLQLSVRDERAKRYNIVVSWLSGKPVAADVEDRFMPGCQVIEGTPIAAT